MRTPVGRKCGRTLWTRTRSRGPRGARAEAAGGAGAGRRVKSRAADLRWWGRGDSTVQTGAKWQNAAATRVRWYRIRLSVFCAFFRFENQKDGWPPDGPTVRPLTVESHTLLDLVFHDKTIHLNLYVMYLLKWIHGFLQRVLVIMTLSTE